jgi:hypothetical protein
MGCCAHRDTRFSNWNYNASGAINTVAEERCEQEHPQPRHFGGDDELRLATVELHVWFVGFRPRGRRKDAKGVEESTDTGWSHSPSNERRGQARQNSPLSGDVLWCFSNGPLGNPVTMKMTKFVVSLSISRLLLLWHSRHGAWCLVLGGLGQVRVDPDLGVALHPALHWPIIEGGAVARPSPPRLSSS